jgi:hypothetical protein
MKKQGWPSIKEELRDFISFVGKRTASGAVFVPFQREDKTPHWWRRSYCVLFCLRLEDATGVKTTAFIDNIRLAGRKDAVARALTLFHHICGKELTPNMQINETLSADLIGKDYTFLGVKCHHDKKSPTISIGDAALQRLKGVDEHSSLQECLSSFGKGIAASRVLGLDVPLDVSHSHVSEKQGWMAARRPRTLMAIDEGKVWDA